MTTVHLDTELIARLNFINTEGLKPGNYPFPDFMIVGPPRTGTTWLYRNLRFHPQVYMSTPKEIIFFDRLDKPNDPHFGSNRLEWYSSFFSIGRVQRMKGILKDLRALRMPRRIMMGEATASYVIMEEPKINEILVLNPKIKVIMAVRNPIDRARSDLKRHLSVKEEVERHFSSKEFADISSETFANFYTSDYMMRCGQFTANIRRWKRTVGPNQVLVYIFDDIIKRPRELLEDIYRFLGVSTRESVFNRNLYTRVIHRITEIEMPREHREFLFDVFEDEIRSLNEMFGLHYS